MCNAWSCERLELIQGIWASGEAKEYSMWSGQTGGVRAEMGEWRG